MARFFPRLCIVLAVLTVTGCTYKPAPPSAAKKDTKPVISASKELPKVVITPTLPPAPPPLPAPPKAAVATNNLPTIGLLLPMSGKQSAIGQSMFNAAQMALFEGAGKLNLRPYDTGDSPATLAPALRQLKADGARLAVGPVFSAQVTPDLKNAGIPVISFSNDRNVAGRGVYVLGLLPHEQVQRVVAYAASQGHNRIAALVPANAYGESIVQAMNIALGQSGGTLLTVERTDGSKDGIKRAWQNLLRYAPLSPAYQEKIATVTGKSIPAPKEGDKPTEDPRTFDALFVGVPTTGVQELARLLDKEEMADKDAIKILGTANWASAPLVNATGLQGAWLAMPSPQSHNNFLTRYRSTYGSSAQPLASTAYDAVALAVALQRSGQGFSPAVLENPAGFAGVDGVFRLLKNGQNQRGLSVVEITGGNVREISPAPMQFYSY